MAQYNVGYIVILGKKVSRYRNNESSGKAQHLNTMKD